LFDSGIFLCNTNLVFQESTISMADNKDSKSRPRLTEEDFKIIKNRNKGILDKVKIWQSFPYVKPLVCQNNGCCECKLRPKMTKFKVILQCPKCRKVQPYVPKTVLKTHLSIPDILLKNKARHKDPVLEEIMDDSKN